MHGCANNHARAWHSKAKAADVTRIEWKWCSWWCSGSSSFQVRFDLLFQGSRLSGDFRFHLIAVILAIFLGSGLDAGAGTSLLKATTSVGNSFASTPSTDSAVAKGARASKLRVLVSWLLFGFGKTHVGFCFHWCFLGTEFLKQLEISWRSLVSFVLKKPYCQPNPPHKKKHQRIELLGTDGLFLSRNSDPAWPSPIFTCCECLGICRVLEAGQCPHIIIARRRCEHNLHGGRR